MAAQQREDGSWTDSRLGVNEGHYYTESDAIDAGNRRMSEGPTDTSAYAGAALAVTDAVSNMSVETLISIGFVGFGGFWAMFFGVFELQRYGFNIGLNMAAMVAIAAGAAVVCRVLLFFFSRLLAAVVVGMFVILLTVLIAPHFTGNGNRTASFKLTYAEAGAGAKLLASPQNNAKLMRALQKGEKLDVIGVTKDGWMRVIVPSVPRLLSPRSLAVEGKNSGAGWVKAEQVGMRDGEQPRLIQNARVISNTLNVRVYPRMYAGRHVELSSKGVMQPLVVKGDVVQVTGEVRNGWVPIFAGSGASLVKGFALADNLFFYGGASAKAPSAPTPPAGARATVTKTYNMRSGRYNSVNFIAKTIAPGDLLVVLNPTPTETGWYHVWFDGEEGYVGKSFLKWK